MYRKFLNARSPMRLLEKGLHGGLGAGNLGFARVAARTQHPWQWLGMIEASCASSST